MVSFLNRDDWGINGQREMDAGTGHQIGLELLQVNIQGSLKLKRGCGGGYYLTHKAIKVGISGVPSIKVSTTDAIDSLIVHHEGTVRVLHGSVGSEDGVVGLNHSCGDLGSWVDGELQLRLLAVIDREAFHQK